MLGSGGHAGSVFLKLISLKGRLRQTALPTPGFPLTGEQALAQHATQHARASILREQSMIAPEHLLDRFGMTHQEEDERPQPNADDVAMLASKVRGKFERLPQDLQHIAQEKESRRTG